MQTENLESLSDMELFELFSQLQSEHKFLSMQEQHLVEERQYLDKELERANEDMKRIQSTPLLVGQFLEMVDENYAVVSAKQRGTSCVRVLSTVPREDLKPSSAVALHPHSKALVGILPSDTQNAIQVVSGDQKPDVTYSDIGGLDVQKQEIREAVEYPITQADLYRQIGIDPPRGCLLYGPPGTGKTLLAKAVAHHTDATFIRVVASEFVQKYLGEGSRMVRDVFRIARENSPSIVFIDEADAVATKRFDSNTGGDREIQRILLEILNQLDGFDQTTDVKVIMATNRADTLDPALVRPGRLDRMIEFPYPDRRQKRLIFQVCSKNMNLMDDVDLEAFVSRPDKLSGADIAAICLEAGMLAVRGSRFVVTHKDFEEAYGSVVTKKDEEQNEFYK